MTLRRSQWTLRASMVHESGGGSNLESGTGRAIVHIDRWLGAKGDRRPSPGAAFVLRCRRRSAVPRDAYRRGSHDV